MFKQEAIWDISIELVICNIMQFEQQVLKAKVSIHLNVVCGSTHYPPNPPFDR